MEHVPRRHTAFPALTALGLNRDHLAALAHQGGLSTEGRPGGRYVKLRFRLAGRQQVRYVGSNAAFVAQVRQELSALQARTQERRQRQRLLQEANACLRRTKHQLAPLLSRAGRRFHGREIRRPRDSPRCGGQTETSFREQ